MTDKEPGSTQTAINVTRWVERLRAVDWRRIVDAPKRFKEAFPERADALQRAIDRTEIWPGGRCHVTVALERNSETGEIIAFSYAVGPVGYPDHIHGNGDDMQDYGERYWTLAGKIEDRGEDGHTFQHGADDEPVTHPAGSRHQPFVRRHWIGVFHQPTGSELWENHVR